MTFLNCCILASFLHTPSETNELRVMVWNVLRGGNSVQQGPEKALQVIRDAAPDVVLLQESYDIEGDRPKLGAWLAGELGWRSFQGDSAHLCVLTPYDIEATYFHHEWHGVGAKLKDPQGRSFVAWSIWLDWRSFVGYELRDHPEMSDAELIEAETKRSGRAAQAEALLNHLKKEGHFNESVPVLLGGDFNCPSHLDWTKDTQRVFERRRALDLPVSQLVWKQDLRTRSGRFIPIPCSIRESHGHRCTGGASLKKKARRNLLNGSIGCTFTSRMTICHQSWFRWRLMCYRWSGSRIRFRPRNGRSLLIMVLSC